VKLALTESEQATILFNLGIVRGVAFAPDLNEERREMLIQAAEKIAIALGFESTLRAGPR
jgi:hypothetical protein